MLLRNMDKKRGLTNGTRLIVHDLSDHILLCFSRAQSLEDIRVKLSHIPEEQGSIKENGFISYNTKNVVFSQVLPSSPPPMNVEDTANFGDFIPDEEMEDAVILGGQDL